MIQPKHFLHLTDMEALAALLALPRDRSKVFITRVWHNGHSRCHALRVSGTEDAVAKAHAIKYTYTRSQEMRPYLMDIINIVAWHIDDHNARRIFNEIGIPTALMPRIDQNDVLCVPLFASVGFTEKSVEMATESLPLDGFTP